MFKTKRHLISWLFISLLVFTNLRVNLMYGLYTMSQDLFVELFCENKDNPELECDGTCMLDKVGSHSHEDHSDIPPLHAVFKVDLNLFAPEFSFGLEVFPQETEPHFFYSNTYSYLESDSIEYPPILV